MLHGDNGQGKTNLLEAVFVLAALRSFRDGRPSRWVRESSTKASLEASVSGQSGRRTLTWRWAAGERSLLLDGLAPSSLEPWFDTLRAVLFCPEHTEIVRGEPEARRSFMDRAVFTARPTYLDLARAYKRVVQQKAALLRTGHARREELDLWDEQLVRRGAAVRARRAQMISELREPFQASIAEISGGERAELRVRGGEEEDEEKAAAILAAAVARARPEELRLGSVLAGPHRDDLEILLDGRLARRFASQGQARTVALALKLAELEAARRRGATPIFLLDDLSSELDERRRKRLIELLLGLGNQVWVTTTDPVFLSALPPEAARFFRVSGGKAA